MSDVRARFRRGLELNELEYLAVQGLIPWSEVEEFDAACARQFEAEGGSLPM